MLSPSAHIDTFTRDNLPPQDQWPDFLLGGFQYPERLNAAVALTDTMVERGFGDRIALIGKGRQRTYRELAGWTNQLARAMVDDLGVKPGNRVLIRSANNPAMVACWLAATKAGAVVVNTMPMLRASELGAIVSKAEVEFALCDTRLMDELEACARVSSRLRTVVGFDGTAGHDAALDQVALAKPARFDAVPTGRDDVALLAFTSGSTGTPKATMHFHRDLLIVADGYAKEVLGVKPGDIFVGSPPLAFAFGLGMAIFPLRFGASAALFETATPRNMIEIIERYGATICFTAPTAYRTMLEAMAEGADLSSLRVAVSAGETLPAPIYSEWNSKTGEPVLDGIGSTKRLHIFVSNRFDDRHPAGTGTPVRVCGGVGDDGVEVPPGTVGRLAVCKPTGCRHLADKRQQSHVEDRENVTGESFSMDENGHLRFAARNDDMIISSGYNIAGPEVEAALLSHSSVAECNVSGVPNRRRNHVVEAQGVRREETRPGPKPTWSLQENVTSIIAPYKHPRSTLFARGIPRTPTGKIQRFKLRKEPSE